MEGGKIEYFRPLIMRYDADANHLDISYIGKCEAKEDSCESCEKDECPFIVEVK